MKGLKRLREDAGLTQQQLAELVGVTTPAVAHWESGDRDPGLRFIQKCREIFGCTFDDLLSDKQILTDKEAEVNGAK